MNTLWIPQANGRADPKRVISALTLCLIFLSGICLAQSPVTLTGKGVATIDAVMSPGEWDGAGRVDLVVNIPHGGTTPATLYVMNDNLNLYVALRFNRSVVDPGNSLVFEFDNDNDGIRENGDDAFGYNSGGPFYDDFRTGADPCPAGTLCGYFDVDYGGTNNGQGAFLNDGMVTVYEMSHPLNSGDVGHDFMLFPGQTVGFYFELRMIGVGNEPDDFGDTTFPTFGLGQILVQPFVPPTLTGKGIAIIDGVLSPGEWDGAGTFDLSVRTPRGGTTPATLYVMNDNLNLYVALRFNRAIADPGNSLVFEFDNDNDGLRENGDDAFGYNSGGPFYDDYRTGDSPCPPGAWCGFYDADNGGANNGQGAFLNDGTFTVYEMSHPLTSGDILHDFTLFAGQTVGFYFDLRMIGIGGQSPQDFGDTIFPDFGGFGHILIQPYVPPVLTGCGTATIDGVLAPGEWDGAAKFSLSVKVPGGNTTPATLYVMNNHVNLYVALRFTRMFVDPGNTLTFEFDNNNNGVPENGDDVFGFTPPNFFDDYRTNAPPCPPGSDPASCGPSDTEGGGTVDGQGAFVNNGTFSVYEMSHPLNSGDIGHDFILNGGQTVGFFLSLRMIGPGGLYPQDFADTDFPGFRNYGSIYICAYSPEQRIALLQGDVTTLVNSGVVTTADTKLMFRSLEDALSRLSQQKVKQAIDELQKFIKEVDKLVKKGKLSTAQGQPLIAAATAMINQLSTPGVAQSRYENGIEEAIAEAPTEFKLDGNYPNPFNPKTLISYQIPAEGLVTLRVYNLLGQEVATLVNGNVRAGRHSVTFDASNLSSGTYLYTLQFGDRVASKAMVLMK